MVKETFKRTSFEPSGFKVVQMTVDLARHYLKKLSLKWVDSCHVIHH